MKISHLRGECDFMLFLSHYESDLNLVSSFN